MKGSCVSPIERRFRFESVVALQLDNIFREFSIFSFCRSADNRLAIDLINLYNKERLFLFYSAVLAQLDRAWFF